MKNNKKTGVKRTSNKYWPIFAIALLALAIACVFASQRSGEEAETKYELETASEIDFTDLQMQTHTADAGIAVVNPSRPEARPAQAFSDPAERWQDTSTHGGFTLPVTMDDDSIGLLTIPDIGVSVRVYQTENEMDAMDRGVWHFRHSSAWEGNISLSAHNINLDNTPGYFLNLHKLPPGAVIRYQTALGVREYTVETIAEISQDDWSMLDRTEDNRITLITCITGRADMRFAVQAVERPPA